MPHNTVAKGKKGNRKRFLEVRTILLLLGIITLLIFLAFYSPNTDIFSWRSSLFALFILGALSGGLLFGVGTGIAAYIWLPELRKQRYYYPNDSSEIRWDEPQPHHYPDDDWDNDYANFASPLHQVIEHSHHHDD